MRIEEIHIYGFGKLEDVSIHSLGDLSVFYGKNEAGKSTLMSFIHSILFGFPTRQQTELRYEPKKTSKYGGKLIVSFPGRGRAAIERVKGKAAGDVSVLLEDGTRGGEELLKELLSRIDKNLYTAIFSFNLHGIQNVHHLKKEDMGKFLFSTGAIGSEALLLAEKNLQKELDLLFKPRGKKPVINEKLREVKELDARLKKAAAENDDYRNLIFDKEKLKDRLNSGEKERTVLQGQLVRLEEWQKLQPAVMEITRTKNQLEALGDSEFPVDGIARLDDLNDRLISQEAEAASLREKRAGLQQSLEKLRPNHALLDKELEINQAVENFSYYEALRQEEQEWQRKLNDVDDEIDSLRERLHLPLSDEELLQINTSVFMKERTEEAMRKQIRLQERKEELDRQFQEEKEGLERSEETVEILAKNILTLEERQEKEAKLRLARNRDGLKRELEDIKEKLRYFAVSLNDEKERMKKRRWQAYFLSFLFLILSFWGFWNSQWLIGIGGVIGMLFLIMTSGREKTSQSMLHIKEEMKRLKEREGELEASLKEDGFVETDFLVKELEKDDARRMELNEAKIRLKQQEEQYERIIKGYESWEKEMLDHRTMLAELAGELRLPEKIAFTAIDDAFLLLSKLKEKVKERERLRAAAQEKTAAFMALHDDFSSLKECFFPNEGLTLRDAVFTLKKMLKAEQEKQIRFEKEGELFRETEEKLKESSLKAGQLKLEKETLFRLAGVSDEESYRSAGKKDEEREKLRRKLAELEDKLHLSPLTAEEVRQFKTIEDVHGEMTEIQQKIRSIEEELNQIRAELAEVNHKIELLEDGKEYARLLHRYHQALSELEQDAKEWAKFAIAKNLLSTTIDRFQKEYLPNMLRKAEEFLAFLTEDNYVRIVPKEDSSGFFIKRKDGLIFEANELSQSTAEQVYVALRLALAVIIYKKLPFPIIIDDSFVNFDRNRAQRAIELLKSMKDNQILFFTCHDHLLPYFSEEMIIPMEKQLIEK